MELVKNNSMRADRTIECLILMVHKVKHLETCLWKVRTPGTSKRKPKNSGLTDRKPIPIEIILSLSTAVDPSIGLVIVSAKNVVGADTPKQEIGTGVDPNVARAKLV